MLSVVFFTQSIGALLANLVAIIVVASLRNSLPEDANAVTCAGTCVEAVDIMWRWIVGLGAVPPAFAILIRWWIPESPRYTLEVEKNPERAKKDMNAYYHPGPALLHMTSSAMPGFDSSTAVHSSGRSINSPATITFGEQIPATLSFGEPEDTNELALADSAGRVPSIPSIGRKMVRKETWKEFRTGFWKYMIIDGNWTDLAGTSLSWMTLDFAYYFLSVNNPKILSKLWNVYDPNEPVYLNLLETNYRALIAVSIGAVLGGILFVVMARYRWSLQVWGFCVLAGLFVVVGVCFVVLLDTRYFAAVIVLYSICSLFFNFGEQAQ
jgi:PHS family inorganic phosphate transporter-like MFS transporter